MKKSRLLMVLLSFSLAFGTIGLFAGTKGALAQISRAAIISEISGTVMVKKSGGSKSFKAFKNMSLNEGDMITTGKGASVVLKLSSGKAGQDTITVDQNSQINFSKLEDKNGTKAKLNVWAGSLWVKVKSISNASDQFEVETPTAIMGVRGTQFLVVADPSTGTTKVVVASGVVNAQKVALPANGGTIQNQNESNNVNIYPTQQISLDSRTESDELKNSVEIIDIDSLVDQASPKIIEAIIKDHGNIQEENEKLIEKLKNDLNNGKTKPDSIANLLIKDRNDLDKVTQNLNNLIGNIAGKAIDTKKINKDKMNEIIDEINKQIEDPQKKIDLTKVKDIDKQAGVDPKLQQQLEKMKELAAKLAEAELEARILKEQQENLQQLIKKIEEAKSKTEQLQKEKDEEQFLKNLTDEQKKKFKENKIKNEVDIAAGSNTGTIHSPSPSNPTVILDLPNAGVVKPQAGGPILLHINFENFNSNKAIYGFEITVNYDPKRIAFNGEAFDSRTQSFRTGNLFKVEPASNWPALSYTPESVDYWGNDALTGILTYAVTKFTGSAVAVPSNSTVVTLPFQLTDVSSLPSAGLPFSISVMAVDSAGNIIPNIQVSNTTLKFTRI